MTQERAEPVACSLGAGELAQRLAAIGDLGAEALLSAEVAGGAHLLRFADSPVAAERLERIVAAERRCCPFLALDLRQGDGELLLSIAAPDGGREVADQLAASFGEPPSR